jgi:uncharacterized membrane protein YfcA
MLIGLGLAILMGVTLGILGGGGSILTVPILAYFFDIPATLATSYSLFVVGITSLFSAFKYAQNKLINLRVAFLFSIPSSIGVLLARRWLLPAVPDWVQWGSLAISKDQLVLITFALLVLVISVFMLKAKDPDAATAGTQGSPSLSALWIIVEGLSVGAITGFVGAGGGFMIVPALVLLAKVPLREAIATSLLIIAFKSLVGFAGDMAGGMDVDLILLGIITGLTISGAWIGTAISARLNVTLLRKSFGIFVLLMGLAILIKELT